MATVQCAHCRQSVDVGNMPDWTIARCPWCQGSFRVDGVGVPVIRQSSSVARTKRKEASQFQPFIVIGGIIAACFVIATAFLIYHEIDAVQAKKDAQRAVDRMNAEIEKSRRDAERTIKEFEKALNR